METQRDRKMFELIEKFKVLSTKHIKELVYPTTSYEFCRNRLRVLIERGEIKKKRGTHIDQCNVYYIDKPPKQIEHMLMRVDIYITLGMPELFDTEYSVSHLRADAYTEVVKDNNLYSFFIETNRFNQFDFDKYIKFYNTDYTKYFHKFPRVVIVSAKENMVIPKSDIKFILIKPDMSNIEKIFI